MAETLIGREVNLCEGFEDFDNGSDAERDNRSMQKDNESLEELLEFVCDDEEYTRSLKTALAKGAKVEESKTWWPTQVFISRFMLKYNLSYGSLGTTMFSKSEYLFQLQPCLEFTYALRKAFGVPVGVGRILNADEVMTYKYCPVSRSWTV